MLHDNWLTMWRKKNGYYLTSHIKNQFWLQDQSKKLLEKYIYRKIVL